MRYYRLKTASDFISRQDYRPHPDSNVFPEAFLARPGNSDTTGVFKLRIS